MPEGLDRRDVLVVPDREPKVGETSEQPSPVIITTEIDGILKNLQPIPDDFYRTIQAINRGDHLAISPEEQNYLQAQIDKFFNNNPNIPVPTNLAEVLTLASNIAWTGSGDHQDGLVDVSLMNTFNIPSNEEPLPETKCDRFNRTFADIVRTLSTRYLSELAQKNFAIVNDSCRHAPQVKRRWYGNESSRRHRHALLITGTHEKMLVSVIDPYHLDRNWRRTLESKYITELDQSASRPVDGILTMATILINGALNNHFQLNVLEFIEKNLQLLKNTSCNIFSFEKSSFENEEAGNIANWQLIELFVRALKDYETDLEKKVNRDIFDFDFRSQSLEKMGQRLVTLLREYHNGLQIDMDPEFLQSIYLTEINDIQNKIVTQSNFGSLFDKHKHILYSINHIRNTITELITRNLDMLNREGASNRHIIVIFDALQTIFNLGFFHQDIFDSFFCILGDYSDNVSWALDYRMSGDIFRIPVDLKKENFLKWVQMMQKCLQISNLSRQNKPLSLKDLQYSNLDDNSPNIELFKKIMDNPEYPDKDENPDDPDDPDAGGGALPGGPSSPNGALSTGGIETPIVAEPEVLPPRLNYSHNALLDQLLQQEPSSQEAEQAKADDLLRQLLADTPPETTPPVAPAVEPVESFPEPEVFWTEERIKIATQIAKRVAGATVKGGLITILFPVGLAYRWLSRQQDQWERKLLSGVNSEQPITFTPEEVDSLVESANNLLEITQNMEQARGFWSWLNSKKQQKLETQYRVAQDRFDQEYKLAVQKAVEQGFNASEQQLNLPPVVNAVSSTLGLSGVKRTDHEIKTRLQELAAMRDVLETSSGVKIDYKTGIPLELVQVGTAKATAQIWQMQEQLKTADWRTRRLLMKEIGKIARQNKLDPDTGLARNVEIAPKQLATVKESSSEIAKVVGEIQLAVARGDTRSAQNLQTALNTIAETVGSALRPPEPEPEEIIYETAEEAEPEQVLYAEEEVGEAECPKVLTADYTNGGELESENIKTYDAETEGLTPYEAESGELVQGQPEAPKKRSGWGYQVHQAGASRVPPRQKTSPTPAVRETTPKAPAPIRRPPTAQPKQRPKLTIPSGGLGGFGHQGLAYGPHKE